MNALVSIYIPTKDRFDLLTRAVNSCLQQTYPHFEIIIADDGSEIPCANQIQQLAAMDYRIRVVRNELSKGACAARNLAIEAANGYFITGLDDDDEFTPQRLQTFVDAWHKLGERYAYLCANSEIIVGGGRSLVLKKRPKKITLDQLLHTNLVGNQLFTKTAYLRSIGGFDIALPARQDYETWIRLTHSYGNGFRIPEITYRVHQDHLYERISSSERRGLGYDYVLKKHAHLMNDAHRKSHAFYRKLYTENPDLVSVLSSAPLRLWPVAIKVISLRMLGYKV